MQVFPQVNIDRVAKLEPGDLFILVDGGKQCVALLSFDPAQGGERMMLVLGPKVPNDPEPLPRLFLESAATAIKFGKNYVLKLPTKPEHWSSQAPVIEVSSILMVDDKPYFRASFVHSVRAIECWIEASNGNVHFNRPPGTGAYALKWEIVVQQPGFDEQVVLRST